jgi:uroporphyrinogen III methyltransferase / synthase
MTRSLERRVVVVTRPAEQSAELARLLEERGARVVVAPAIAIEPADPADIASAAERLRAGEFEWIVLTSRAGVEALFAVLGDHRPPARVAAVGESTARALGSFRVEPDLVPGTFTTEALGEAFPWGQGRVLLARADIASAELEAVIAAKGWTVERVDAYRTSPVRTLPEEAIEALSAGRVDAVTLTSASTVRGFVDAARRAAVDLLPPAVCIGPVTAAAARQAGLDVAAEASPHTIEGLVEALERVLGADREDPDHR